MEDTANPWYDNQLISHGAGEKDSVDVINSQEGLDSCAADGYKIIEVDLKMTSDHALVLTHDWDRFQIDANWDEDRIPTYEEFMGQKVINKYSPVSTPELFQFMQKYPDIYIVTDTKDNNIDIIQQLVEDAKHLHKEKILNRLIIQIYSPQEYSDIQKIYPFENVIYTLYKLDFSENLFIEAIRLCQEKKINVVTIPASHVIDRKEIEEFTKRNIKIYVHTVNDLPTVKRMFDLGVNGVYTDRIKPQELSNLKYY